MADPVVVETARAKVNLDLHVLGRRSDGYHELDSLVAFAELGDELVIRPAERLELNVTGPFANALAAESSNLVTRAAQVLAHAIGRAPEVAISLDKRLPVAAGIGGGSADAAATLRGLGRLWSLDLPEPTLAELARQLGADVPACLASRPLHLRGMGEMVTALSSWPRIPAVLVTPDLPLATARVFEERRPGEGGARSFEPTHGEDACAAIAMLSAGRNDLEAAALRLAPEVGDALERLRHVPGCRLARMSGSGPTCFGLFETEGECAQGAVALRADRPEWWIAATWLGGR